MQVSNPIVHESRIDHQMQHSLKRHKRTDNNIFQATMVKPTRQRRKHVPHREREPAGVQKRNARERHRVQAVNTAFKRLRAVIPYERRHCRLSKFKTLQTAVDYIQSLCLMIQEYDSRMQLDGGVYGFHTLDPKQTMQQSKHPDGSYARMPWNGSVGSLVVSQKNSRMQPDNFNDFCVLGNNAGSDLRTLMADTDSSEDPTFMAGTESTIGYSLQNSPEQCSPLHIHLVSLKLC